MKELREASAEAPALLCTGIAPYQAGLVPRMFGRTLFDATQRPNNGTHQRSRRGAFEPDFHVCRNPIGGSRKGDNAPMKKQILWKAAGLCVALPIALFLWLMWKADEPNRERLHIDERLRAIDAGIRSEAADMQREMADCRATETEDAQHQAIGETCWETIKAIKRASDLHVRSLEAERQKLSGRLNELQH